MKRGKMLSCLHSCFPSLSTGISLGNVCFSTLAFSLGGVLACAFGMFSRITALYSLYDSDIWPVVGSKNVFRHCQMLPWRQNLSQELLTLIAAKGRTFNSLRRDPDPQWNSNSASKPVEQFSGTVRTYSVRGMGETWQEGRPSPHCRHLKVNIVADPGSNAGAAAVTLTLAFWC